MASSKKVHAIGIDLGTTYSCVGVWHRGHVKVIANDQGNRITPSCVAFTSDLRLIGEAARNQADRNPTNTIFGIKRLIGRRFSDKTVESDRKLWPFDVIQDKGDKPKIVVQYKEKEKQFLPEELSAIILEKMKKIAENFLECNGKDVVINAVITVPAYFNDSQRRATMVAGNIAGLNVMRIIDEPTAAAVAYGFEKLTYVREEKNVLVFDLGGGTFDVSVLNINKGVFEVKATAGDTHLGGEDFDNRLLIHFIEQIKRKHKKDIIDNPKSIRRLRSACEQAKKNVSFEISTTVDVPGLYDGTDFTLNITRARFEDLNMDLFERCMGLVTKCLEDAHMEKTAIDVVVLVGGSTRIPKVQKMLQDLFDGKELCISINPDEAVAYGATVQAAKLSSQGNQEILDMVLLDVTPLSLGINLIGGIMSVVVPRNTVIPTIMWSGFTPSMDNQTVVKFEVFEGERAQTKDNYRLGEFSLSGITLAPRGVTNLDVCFEIDANGILNVSAQDRSNGRKNQITVTHEEDSLNDYQIKDIIRDVEMYRARDEECRRSYEARLSLEVYACSMKNAMKNKRINDTLPCATKIRIEDAIKETLSWVDDNSLPDVVESKSRMEKLKSICATIDCI